MTIKHSLTEFPVVGERWINHGKYFEVTHVSNGQVRYCLVGGSRVVQWTMPIEEFVNEFMWMPDSINSWILTHRWVYHPGRDQVLTTPITIIDQHPYHADLMRQMVGQYYYNYDDWDTGYVYDNDRVCRYNKRPISDMHITNKVINSVNENG